MKKFGDIPPGLSLDQRVRDIARKFREQFAPPFQASHDPEGGYARTESQQLPTVAPPDEPEFYGRPLFQTASVTLAAGTESAVDATALNNPTQEPIEITEFRFTLRSVDPVSGSNVFVRVDSGRITLTNGFVPIYLVARAENPIVSQIILNGNSNYFRQYHWKPEKPFWLPPGGQISFRFVYKGLTSNPVTVHASYLGRVVGYVPKIVHVPWVSAYLSKVMNGDTADTDSSGSTDISNPFGTNIHIQWFGGVVEAYYIDDISATFHEINGDDFVGYMIEVRITRSDGAPIIRSFVPWRAAFSMYQTLDVTHDMEPGCFYQVFVNKKVPVNPYVGGACNFAFVQCIVGVSIVGWRDIDRGAL